MVGENAYIKGMEQQLSIVAEKVERFRVEAALPEVEQKLAEVNKKFNALRDENPETFDTQRTEFETAFNELSQLVTDNSELKRSDIKAQEELRRQTGVVSRG
jgi:archaellum component FlaC